MPPLPALLFSTVFLLLAPLATPYLLPAPQANLQSTVVLLLSLVSLSASNPLELSEIPEICEEPRKLRVSLEAPLNTTNSYSLVAANLALALAKRRDVEVSLHKLPNYSESWPAEAYADVFREDQNALLGSLPRSDLTEGWAEEADVTLRVNMNFGPPLKGGKLAVLATTERGYLAQEAIAGDVPLADLDGVLVAPTEWAKGGFVASGREEVKVVPHGVDVTTFFPLPAETRLSLRQQAEWASSFVFLHVSSMTDNKNVELILEVFRDVAYRFEGVKLVLKGNDALYGSRERLLRMDGYRELEEAGLVEYYGDDLSNVGIAQMQQLADVYLAPYKYEGGRRKGGEGGGGARKGRRANTSFAGTRASTCPFWRPWRAARPSS
jgi:hypothetical protein